MLVLQIMVEERVFNRWIVVIGGIIIQLALGTIYCWGNMGSYITPFLNSYSATEIDNSQTLYIFALSLLTFAITMIFSGQLQHKIGPMKVGIIGGIIVSGALLLSSFMTTFVGMLFTYGMMFGIGIGFAYVCPIAAAAKWFPDKKGLINGLAVAGFGASAFIFNIITTAFVNPDNIVIDATVFLRVPTLLRILALIFAIMIIGGSLTLKLPPENYQPKGWNPPALKEGSSELASTQDFPREKAVKLPQFWMLWSMFILTAASGLFIVGYYKTFGKTATWSNDLFLSQVGAWAALFNGLGRIVWGKLSDSFGYKKILYCFAGLQTVLMVTFALTIHSQVMFFIWVCLIYFCFGGNFSLYPTATIDLFGAKNLGPNYGVIYTAYGIAGVSGALLTKPIGEIFGVWGLFITMGVFSVGAIVIAFFLKQPKNE